MLVGILAGGAKIPHSWWLSLPQLLSAMAHDFKIKLAQATQEKVEALLKAAQLAQSVADQQQQQAATGAASGGGTGAGAGHQAAAAVPVPHRLSSQILADRQNRELSRSPGAGGRCLSGGHLNLDQWAGPESESESADLGWILTAAIPVFFGSVRRSGARRRHASSAL
jgi:hypothetical protein